MKKERLETLLLNFITYFETEVFENMTLYEKIDFLKDEIGFTDEEIEELEIENNCL